jgi:hypothetical protein
MPAVAGSLTCDYCFSLCTVNLHCVTSPMLRRGGWVIHFALQALQLHATPANPSPHMSEFSHSLRQFSASVSRIFPPQ